MDGGLARGLFVLSSWSRQPGSMCGDCRNHRARLPVRLARSLARSLDCIGRTRLSANALRECRCTARGTVASANVSPIHYTCDRDRSRTYTPVSAFSSRVFPLDLLTCRFTERRISIRRSRLRISRICKVSRARRRDFSFSLPWCDRVADLKSIPSENQVSDVCLFCLEQTLSLSLFLSSSLFRFAAWPLLHEVTHSRRMNERASGAASTCREHFIRDASYAGPLSDGKGFPGRTSPRCLRKVLLRASVSMRDTGSARRAPSVREWLRARARTRVPRQTFGSNRRSIRCQLIDRNSKPYRFFVSSSEEQTRR